VLCACTQFQFDIVTTHKFVRVYLLFFLSIHVSLSLSLCSFVSLSVSLSLSLSLSQYVSLSVRLCLSHTRMLFLSLSPPVIVRARVCVWYFCVYLCVCARTRVRQKSRSQHQQHINTHHAALRHRANTYFAVFNSWFNSVIWYVIYLPLVCFVFGVSVQHESCRIGE